MAASARGRVLVIGGTQFMGRATVAALLDAGHFDVTILNRGRTHAQCCSNRPCSAAATGRAAHLAARSGGCRADPCASRCPSQPMCSPLHRISPARLLFFSLHALLRSSLTSGSAPERSLSSTPLWPRQAPRTPSKAACATSAATAAMAPRLPPFCGRDPDMMLSSILSPSPLLMRSRSWQSATHCGSTCASPLCTCGRHGPCVCYSPTYEEGRCGVQCDFCFCFCFCRC